MRCWPFFFLIAALAAQTQTGEVTSRDEAPTFQSSVNLVRVPVVVRDKSGHTVGGLQKSDFRLTDLGKPQEIAQLLKQLDGWEFRDGVITKTYPFKNYYQTMAFVNAVAWISHREDHHPDMTVGYNKCKVDYSTHAIGGMSENDFICAAKLDALFSL